ncbi:YkvA family protein [Peterkaempfera sp. SMS 1(5)a]|uniref:YkvA family protein n=1 Tax=Peterkaempfera podocarpi TaxID=3232308 RepID=UPI00366A816D
MAGGKGRHPDAREVWALYEETRRPGVPGLAARVAAAPRLFRTALRGEYPHLPRGRTLVCTLLMLVYLASPLDAVPDFIPVVGWMDDAGVLMWTLRALVHESGRFLLWEQATASAAEHRP